MAVLIGMAQQIISEVRRAVRESDWCTVEYGLGLLLSRAADLPWAYALAVPHDAPARTVARIEAFNAALAA